MELINAFIVAAFIKRRKKKREEEEYKSIAVEEELTIEETQILKENEKWDKIATIN